ncbi:MAG TPA: glycoside hydrolase family 3 N-terminal domain-containing protein [Chitinivibrionales bacterium]|nr:glycoside hydrolase family 3 N-terminal domain-containing protein [Chitinivibrionales bacterium]
MKHLSFFSLALVLTFFLTAQADVPRGYVTNTGIVVDSSGKPVRNAYISYVTLDKRFTWSYSLNDGSFGGPVGVRNPALSSNAASGLQLMVRGKELLFHVSRGDGATVELFDMQGRSLGIVLNKIMDNTGFFAFSPFASSTKNWAYAMYLAKVTVNGKSECVKIMNQFRAGSVRAGFSSGPAMANRLGKIAAFIDTLRVGKTGYYSAIVPIASYTDPVGTVKIVKMDVAKKVDSVFALMTPAEKAGAINEPNFDNANAAYYAQNLCGFAFAGGDDGPGGHSISNWTTFTKALNAGIRATRLHIPILCGVDNVHGASAVETAVILPHNCAMGCTWDPQFVEKAYRMVGCEIRGTGEDWMLAPCVAVCRDDRYGRLYEGYSENPDLAAAIAKSAVLGLSTGDLGHPNAVGVCCKHFCGDGGSTNGTMAGPCDTSYEHVTYEQLKYIHLLTYEECFKVCAISIMDQFGSWMGTTCSQNSAMNIDWLRGEQHFQGFVNGDWGTQFSNFQYGLDVAMPSDNAAGCLGNAKTFFTSTPTSVRGDQGIKGVLTPKMWMFGDWGFYNKPIDDRMATLIGCADHRDIGREAVRKSCVLVKNNGALPATVSSKIACVGAFMNDVGLQCGGWTLSWQSHVSVPGGTSFYQGLQQVGGNNVTLSGNGSGADIAIVAIGENPYAETAFPDINIDVSPVNAVTGAKKVVLVVVSGRPVDFSSVISKCDAIIIAMWPGSEGEGLADLIYGKNDFTGKLSYTWPANLSQEPINWGYPYNGKAAYGTKVPQWPFGFGLNYEGDTLHAEDGLYTQVSVDSLRE